MQQRQNKISNRVAIHSPGIGTMQNIVVASLGLMGVFLAILYGRYWVTPNAKWKRSVRRAVAEWEAKRQALSEQVVSTNSAESERTLEAEFFSRYLQSIPVDTLVRFPGIGPATVTRIYEAGFVDLDSLLRADLASIPGLSAGRSKELLSAIQKAKRDAKSQFDAGACSAAIELAFEQQRLKRTRVNLRADSVVQLQAAEAALKYLEKPNEIAGQISYLQFLGRRHVPGLTPGMLARSLTPPALVVAQPAPLEVDTPKPAAIPEPPRSEVSPLDRLRAVAGLGYAVAKIDGRIAAGERRQIRAFLERKYATDSGLRKQLDAISKQTESQVPSLDDALAEICRVVSADAWPDLYQFAVSVTNASGERNARKEQGLARIGEVLKKVQPVAVVENPKPIEQKKPWTEADCREVLEIAADTPLGVELIRRQYNLLSDRFEASKFTEMGPEFKALAADKLARIERGARQLIARFNEPLEAPVPEKPADLRHNPDLDAMFG